MDVKSEKNVVKTTLENLSKEELLDKYKGLLNLAKKAKQTKDEFAKENADLKEELARSEMQKEADKNALKTMQEMLEQFTEQKLKMAGEISELKCQHKKEVEQNEQHNIENESLRRQITRLTEDNESLLADIERMEIQLQQVNVLGKEQRQHLNMLEHEVNKLRSSESENADLMSNLEASKSALKELSEKYDFVKHVNSEQRAKFNALKDRFLEVHRKLKKLQNCKKILLETQHEYADSVSKWQMEIINASHKLCEQMNNLKKENEVLVLKLQQQQPTNISNLDVSQLAALEVLAAAALAEQQTKDNDNEILTKKIKTMNSEHLTHILELEHLIAAAVMEQQSCTNVNNNKDKLCTENIKLRSALEETHDALEKIEQENIILLEQIQNQAVSDATSTITTATMSEQEHVLLISELQAQREELEANNINLLRHNKDLSAQLAQKEHEHADLLREMRELNEALKGRGDVISRQQEKQQELHAELKVTSTKLTEIEQALVEKNAAIIKLEEQISQLKEELQHLKTSDVAPLDDTQSDISSMSRAEEFSRLREADECFETKYNKLRSLAIKLKKKLQEQSGQINDLEESQKAYEELQQQHKELQKQLEQVKLEHQKLKNTRSNQTNVLNLEIEAAEKTLKENNAKLQAKTQELSALQEQLLREQERVQQLRQQLTLLELEKASECAHAKELKEQVDFQQKQLKETLNDRQQVGQAKEKLKQEVQQQQLEIESMKLQLSESMQKQAQVIEKMHKNYEQLEREYLETMEAQKSAQLLLKATIQELEQVRIEYADYKLKAQTVLRKHQSAQESGSKVLEMQAELNAMQQRERQLILQQEQHEQRNMKMTQDMDNLTEQHEQLLKRYNQLLSTVENLRTQNDKLVQESRLQLLQQQEALQAQRQQMEQLKTCHEQQLVELKAILNEQELKAKENIKLNSTDQSKIDYLLIKREDAEGSEEAELAIAAANRKISTASRRSQYYQQPSQNEHDFMPLDELLNTPISAMSDTVTTISGNHTDINDNNNIGDTHQLLLATREQLVKQERRVRHLTTLLAENEQDLAKLNQMNDMLKEELRRQERSVEREQHMHNSEYLKNVVFKFLTLNNNDERTRLVPVLNTILKLSRSETDMLNSVAKGQKVSNNGWSNYLPWTSGTN